jgi:hypothetical protein
LTLANANLTLGTNAVAGSFSAANMIVCNGSAEVRHNYISTGAYPFPVGDVTDVVEYSPLTVNVTAGSFSSAYVGVSVIDGLHPNNASASHNLTRYWNVNQSGITGAVATITAAYVPADVTGVEAEVSGGQLNGTFNRASNPWLRYAPLSSNSFIATGAPLVAGETAHVTGVNGSSYSTVISGYGVFCVNDSITLTATPSGGDGPYTYAWSSGLGTQATAVAPSATVGTVNYTVTVTDSNGFTASESASVTASAPAVAGTVSGSPTWCYSKRPDNITVSGFTGTVQKWQYATDASFTSPVDIPSVATVLEQINAQPAVGTLYYRAFIGGANTCPPVATAGFAVTGGDLTTYTGGAWVPAAPNALTTSIVFDDNYAPTGAVALRGCDCTVNAGAVVVIPSASVLELLNEINVSGGAGTKMTFANNAALLQSNSKYSNNGNIEVQRNSSSLIRLDYTMWSSPVIGTQTLKDFSPLTVNTRFYRYNEATNLYNAVDALNTTFGAGNTGKGYLIRMPDNHPSAATVWTSGKFIGTPANGTIAVPVSTTASGFNLIGNPYPSQLDINQFLTDNSANIESTLYFWRKTNEAVPTTPAQSGYCTYTGGNLVQGSAFTNGTDPLGKIQIGQGFIVKAKAGVTTVTFNNGMRVSDTANHFFRAASPESVNTLWMNSLTSSGGFAQMALSYRDNAALGVDVNDGLNIGDGQISFGSWLDNRNFIIQSRPLPFDLADAVPLTFRVNIDGNYTIAIDHVNGFFSNGAQPIYVRDNVLNTVTNLTAGNYTFASTASTFNSRFDIVYQPLLNNPTTAFNENSVVVYKNNGDIVVNTGNVLMKAVQIYDMRGRLLLDKTNINAAEVRLNIGAANQVVLVKTTLDEGQVVTKKVIN